MGRDMGSTVLMAGTMGSTGPTIPHRNDPLDQRPLIPRRAAEMDTRIEPRRAAWRMLSKGSTIWAPLGERGWRPEIITGLGKNRRDRTVVHLHFENGGSGQRYASQLYRRKPELKGRTSRRQNLLAHKGHFYEKSQ